MSPTASSKMSHFSSIKSVAVIGAGASGNHYHATNARLFSLTKFCTGAAAAAALTAEGSFDRIRVFERRSTPGGTWIYDEDPGQLLKPTPGHLPPDLDPPSRLPSKLPANTYHEARERYAQTPVYAELT